MSLYPERKWEQCEGDGEADANINIIHQLGGDDGEETSDPCGALPVNDFNLVQKTMAQQNYHYNASQGNQHPNQPQQVLAPRPPINEDFQKQIQQDWANREYIEVISGSIKRIADFLNSFDLSCRYRLAQLNEKLTSLERKIEVLEAWISKGETLP